MSQTQKDKHTARVSFIPALLQRVLSGYLNQHELSVLEAFGKQFGQEAYETKLKSMLQNKTHKPAGQILAEIYKKALRQNKALVGQYEKKLARQKITKLHQVAKPAEQEQMTFLDLAAEQQAAQEKQEAFAAGSKPLLQALSSLRFWHDVVARYVSETARDQFEARLAIENRQYVMDDLVLLIEQRSGQKIKDLMLAVSEYVVSDFGQWMADSIDEVRKIDKLNQSDALLDAYGNGDIHQAAKIYQQVSRMSR